MSATTQKRSRHSTDTVREFHAEVPQAIANEGLAQSPYVAARAGFESANLRTKGTETTNEPPRPTNYYLAYVDRQRPGIVSFLLRVK